MTDEEEVGGLLVCQKHLEHLALILIVKPPLESFRLKSVDDFAHPRDSCVATILVLLSHRLGNLIISLLHALLVFLGNTVHRFLFRRVHPEQQY